MTSVPQSTELRQVLTHAREIARDTDQPLSTGHVLLALFTVQNLAAVLLAERGVDEQFLLSRVERVEREPESLVKELSTRAGQCAREHGDAQVHCLHLLAALTRMPRAFGALWLQRAGVDIVELRRECLRVLLDGVPAHLDARASAASDTMEMEALPAHVGLSAEHESIVVGRTTTASVPAVSTRPIDARDGDRRASTGRRASDRPDDADEHRYDLDDASPARRPVKPVAEAGADERPGPYVLNRERFRHLIALGRNLSHAAWLGELDPVYGRESEIETCIDILNKRRSNNPCLVGEPGVGKTAIAEGVAARLVAEDTARDGQPTRVLVQIDVGAILAGTHLRGALAERLRGLQDEVRDAQGAVIVFVDELHTLIGAGGGDGAHDASNELKSALARGQFPCIGATTYDEYRRHIEQDPALERRFTPVHVEEPDVATTRRIVEGALQRYAEHHQVRYEPLAIEAAVRLGRRYLHERRDPDRALALLDLAGSVARRGGRVVDRRVVAEVIARNARVPLDHLLVDDPQRFLEVEARLGERIVGQGHALEAIGRTIRRNVAGFAGRRPIGSFLFLGPTGVGKTETVKATAEFLFGHGQALLRFDMSEYLESHAVSRLIGSPPGYVGHTDGGQLTEAVRKRPYQVVLFDEIEKSHREVWNVLLQVLDEGRLTDGRGRVVDFTNTVIVLTSNLGAELFGAADDRRIGFAGASESDAGLEERVLQKARSALPPELWNRIETRVVFRPLGRDEVRRIARSLLADRARLLETERSVRLEVTEVAVDWLLARGGFDARLGARPMRQVIAREVEAPLAERLLCARIVSGDTVRVGVLDGALNFERVAPTHG